MAFESFQCQYFFYVLYYAQVFKSAFKLVFLFPSLVLRNVPLLVFSQAKAS